MRKAFLYIPILLLLTACGGGDEEEKKAPTVVPGASESSHTKETVINNPMDSTLMAEYMKLTKEMKIADGDSLKFQFDSLAANNDSLLKVIMSMKATIDESLPVKFPEPDTIDYYMPPNGNTTRNNYFLFEGVIPEKGKAEKVISKDLIGTFKNSDNSNARITISKTDMVYTNAKGRSTKIFNISSDQNYTQSNDFHLLQYKIKDNWVVVLIQLKHNSLSYKTIPKTAKISTKPSKKEVKKFLEEDKGKWSPVFDRMK